MPSYLKTIPSLRHLTSEDEVSGQALIDFLNDQYGQQQEFKDYDCEDGSETACAQAQVDQV